MRVVTVARRPSGESMTETIIHYGCGSINVEECRIGVSEDFRIEGGPSGRWPANVILQHLSSCQAVCSEGCPSKSVDDQGEFGKGGARTTFKKRVDISSGWKIGGTAGGFSDSGYASRFFLRVK